MTRNLEGESQERARKYQGVHLRLLLFRLFINLIFVIFLLFFGVSKAYAQYLSQFVTSPWGLVALYFLGLATIYSLLLLPLHFYEGYLIEHRFNQSTQKFFSWLGDRSKSLFLELAIGLALIEVVYLLLRHFPKSWWVVTGLAVLLFSVVFSQLAPLIILPLFYSTRPLQNQELVRRLTGLTKKAKVKAQKVFEVNLSKKTKAAEAALTGLGNTRRILIADTLLQNYSHSEIESIFAHELGHYMRGHIPKLVALQALLAFGGLYLAHLILKKGVSYFGFGMADVANFPLLILVIALFALFALPLTNGYSRILEYEADRYALDVTKDPGAFATALTKIARQNLAVVSPHPLAEFILYSHPSIGKRLKLAEGSGGG